jgi:hypothetical protein
MGLNLAQIYLRDIDFADFLKAVGPAWSRSIESDQEPRKRQLLVLFRQPWIALVDSTGELPKTLALELSGPPPARGDPRFREQHDADRQALRDRQRGTGGRPLRIPSRPGGLMPMYADAEMEIWDILGKLGVPPELRLLRGRDIAGRNAKKGEQSDLVLLERKEPGAEVGHVYMVFDLKAPRAEEDGPPAEFSLIKAQEKLYVDLYVATVTPDAERVDHLLTVLEAIARRKPRPPLHHYKAVVTPDTDDEARAQEAMAFLRERYRELAKTRPLAFTL